MEATYDRGHIDAREALLDAVEALGPHGDAAILVGAQAIYVHTASVDSDFGVSPFTYDADIAIDPSLLTDSPPIVDAMRVAGFRLENQPGLYRKDPVSRVDLLVPEAVGGPRRRAARLGVHGNRAAMKVRGLEGALVIHSQRTIGSLIPYSARSCVLKIAGPAALLVAKVHKIAERLDADNPSRRDPLPKDGFDVYRLLRATETSDMASELRILRSSEI